MTAETTEAVHSIDESRLVKEGALHSLRFEDIPRDPYEFRHSSHQNIQMYLYDDGDND